MEPAREPSGPATVLLRQMSQGDRRAADDLLSLLYGELHALARQAMAGKPAHTLQPTALVHEACLRLLAGEDPGFSSRAHFLGVAAKAMRSILVDSARKRGAQKRGGEQARVPLESLLDVYERELPDLLELDEALTRLFAQDEQLGRIVELRFFGGLSVEETAKILGVSEATIVRGWRVARLWLQRELHG
ncbi:MAG TPA: sigma-70 family RNA polymerase sigma factor [Planctomycetota bacterium]|nr:sigma-70 family RNA polymerase sigma factor [Planctomycetota bacterium]